jgi:anti-anti-sigma factor
MGSRLNPAAAIALLMETSKAGWQIPQVHIVRLLCVIMHALGVTGVTSVCSPLSAYWFQGKTMSAMPFAIVELPVSLELRIRDDSDPVVLHCGGEIVSGETVQTFRSAVIALLQRHHSVIVDLSGIRCMDRRGLETLVGLYSTARIAHASVKFANLTIEVTDSHTHRKHAR